LCFEISFVAVITIVKVLKKADLMKE